MNGIIPDPRDELAESGQTSQIISPQVTQIPEKEEELEAKPYKISFQDYKLSECGVDGMTPQNASCLLKIIKDIGINYTDRENFLKHSPFLREVKSVNSSGDYSVLYNGLQEDQEVFEIKHVHEKKNIDIRLFFFTIENEKTFYILAIQGDSHYDTSKSYKPDYREKKKKW